MPPANSTAAPPAGKFRSAVRWLFPPLTEWKGALPAFGFAILSAVLLRFAYLPFFWSPIALVAMVPLFWGLRRLQPNMAFWVGTLFGGIMGWVFTGWLTIVSRFNPFVYAGIPPLALWLGMHVGVATAAIMYVARRVSPWTALIAAMAIWAGMEYFKMIGRFALPYGLLAQSQGGWLSLAKVVSLGGMPLLSALIIGVNLSLFELIAAVRAGYGQGGAAARAGTMAALVVAGHLYGAHAISQIDAAEKVKLRVALLQPAISQERKFASYAAENAEERRKLQEELTREQLDMIAEVPAGQFDLIVTPESSFTQSLFDAEESIQRTYIGGVPMLEVQRLATELHSAIIVGGVDNAYHDKNGKETEYVAQGYDMEKGQPWPGDTSFGGLWLIRPGGEGVALAADYRKAHLMPFGEEVPYLDLIPGFQEYVVQIGSFEKGEPIAGLGMKLDALPDRPAVEVKAGPSICFEDLMPAVHRHYARNNVQFFVNTTNDAWFDGSKGAQWHGDMARWRSIETGIPMIRSTNSGFTYVTDGAGRVVAQLPLAKREILSYVAAIPATAPGATPYARIGDLAGLASLLGSVLFLLHLCRKNTDTA